MLINRNIATILLLTAEAAYAFNVQRRGPVSIQVSIRSRPPASNKITLLHESTSEEQERETSEPSVHERDKELKYQSTERKRFSTFKDTVKKYNPFANPIKSKEDTNGGLSPSPLTIFMATSKKTKYKKEDWGENVYKGTKPILVICTDEELMEMENKKKFSTGNHPVEMLVPMLHLQDIGFQFEFATLTGGDVKLEMWAFPTKDENVKRIHEELKEKMDNPKKIADITSIDEYSAVFIPGGHGCMINLPFSLELGKLLRQAHEQTMPIVTLCHGPAVLLSTVVNEDGKFEAPDFPFKDYNIMCFTDATDKKTPGVGYLPGNMPWKLQETLEKQGITVMNKTEKGTVNQDRELITGDSPYAAQNLGVFAAPIVAKWATENKM